MSDSIKTLSDLCVDHDYYCSDNNYSDNSAAQTYPTWEYFIKEYRNADPDFNLVFRWDMKKENHINDETSYYLEIFVIQQRKGRFVPIMIESVKESNVTEILEFLNKAHDKLKSIWKPLK